MKKIALLFVIVLLGVSFGFSQDLTSKEKKAQLEQEIKEMIENRDFVFHAKSIRSSTGGKLDLSLYHDLSIQGMYVEANLPYYCALESDNTTWDDDAITFSVEAESVEVKYNEKRNDYEIFILVDTGRNIFNMKMLVGMNGCAFLTIMSAEYETVSYFGIVDRPEYLDAYLN